MKPLPEIEGINTEKLAKEILKHASQSHTEEDIKMRIELTLRKILEKLGIDWAKYEHGHKFSGRKDALYGTVIIEYKAPRKLEKEFKKAKEQLKKYIENEAKKPENFGKYFGVLIDGYNISFLRYRRNKWEEDEKPHKISSQTIFRLLEILRGLRRKPIDAEELLRDFGPRSERSRKIIWVLYETLSKPKFPRTKMLFEDWKRVFSQVCAYSPEKFEKLVEYYNLKERKNIDLEKLMFAIHTYYTILMKLLTSEIVTLFGYGYFSYLKTLEESFYKNQEEMKEELKRLEEGGIFREIGILNFLEADYFAWYLDEWNKKIAESIYEIVKTLSDYEPATVELTPERVKDLFKRLYQNLVPRDIRHKLGEYFTPDWLAELVLDEIEYDGNPDKKVLDPACGSGTFLVLAIKRVKEWAEDNLYTDYHELLKKIVSNIRGIDLNPLAVLAAKANYLIALSGLLRYRPREGIEIPIYLADSIAIERGKKWNNLMAEQEDLRLYTAEGEFWIPVEVVEKNILGEVMNYIDSYVKANYSEKEFREVLKRHLDRLGVSLSEHSISSIVRLFRKIKRLDKQKKNRIWTSLLKNSFAPLLIGKFDYVVGNPPWINWESLPEVYRNREEVKNLWNKYGLLEKTKGIGLGKVKRDISMLFVARCFDLYVNDNGRLGFLIPFTVYKTQAGAGFRKWLAENVKVVKVHDLVTLYPFEGAVNRTSMLIIEHGKTKFPIPCVMWHNPRSKGIDQEAELEEVKKITRQFDLVLIPIIENKVESPWMIISEKAFGGIKKTIGKSEYRAFEGVNTALNGVYWIDVISEQPNGLLITNPPLPSQKKKVKQVKQIVEKDLVYPLIRGRDVKKWYPTSEMGYIILPTNEEGKNFSIHYMKVNFPNTYKYFSKFKQELEERSLYKLAGKDKIWFGIHVNIGKFTFAPYKVVWKYVAGKISGKAEFSTAVLEPVNDKFVGKKPVIPNEKLMLIPLDNKEEAYYVSGILNSSPAELLVASYVIETAISTHILNKIKTPKFNPKNKLHLKLSQLSKKAHELAKKYYEQNDEKALKELKKVEEEIDKTVAKLYGINEKELKEIKRCLRILKGETNFVKPNSKKILY